jgi:hypothetical protein
MTSLKAGLLTLPLLLATPTLCYAQASGTPSASEPAGAMQQQPGPQPRGGQMVQRFENANTTHDGKLTLEQAQSGHMPAIAKHFADIDINHRGYITMDDIRSWHMRMMATRNPPQGGAAPPQ